MVIHAVGSTIRLMTLQRAEFTWLIFSIQGSIAFLPYTIRPLTEKPGGFTGVDQFIGFLVNDAPQCHWQYCGTEWRLQTFR